MSARDADTADMVTQLPYEHFKSAHSFGLNTGISLIHYPPISPSDRLSKDHLDIRAGGKLT